MNDIKSLENIQLGIYSDVVEKRISMIKLEILENIKEILGKKISIDTKTYNTEKLFYTHCKNYRSIVDTEKKELFYMLAEEKDSIKKEIEKRQKKMLQDIKISNPSQLVASITKEMSGTYFPMFDRIIRHIKTIQEKNTDIIEEKLYIPDEVAKLEKLGWIINIITNNLWPTPN